MLHIFKNKTYAKKILQACGQNLRITFFEVKEERMQTRGQINRIDIMEKIITEELEHVSDLDQFDYSKIVM